MSWAILVTAALALGLAVSLLGLRRAELARMERRIAERAPVDTILSYCHGNLMVNDVHRALGPLVDGGVGSGWALDAAASGTFDGYDVFTFTSGATVIATVAVDEDVQTNIAPGF